MTLTRSLLRTLLLIALLLASSASHHGASRALADSSLVASPAQIRLQAVFARAAREFHVPERILLAVAYNEARWDDHHGAPSTSGGYGIMHLVHVDEPRQFDAKGDARSGHVREDPALHTLDTAAGILGLPRSALERDPVQNVRGGAALLARYARQTTHTLPTAIADWYGAVAGYSRSPDAATAFAFADDVYATMRHGASRTTSDNQRLRLAPLDVSANKRTAGSLHLQVAAPTRAECPPQLLCRFTPAAYSVNNPNDPRDYGNYDAADRPTDGLAIRYIVIHDTEVAYDKTIVGFQNPTRYASSNYVIRAVDGQVTQMVRDRDIAWHAGNYYLNMHAIGIEHEGIAIEGAKWYSEELYHASATLVRYLALRYHVPLDRAHIIGHDEVPGPTPATQTSQHWDPGPYWDWQHYMDLLGAPLLGNEDVADENLLAITPSFALNQPDVSYCYSDADCRDVPLQPANFVYLHTAPSPDAPLLSDPALHPASEAGTTRANDWGDKAVTGQEFYRVDHQGDWDAIDFGGQEAWFFNPGGAATTPVEGTLVTPRAGRASIPVYGRAYPERSAYPKRVPKETIVPLQYTIPAAQLYVTAGPVSADYYWSPTQTRHVMVRGKTTYYQIFFNHRFAFVKAGDVDVRVPSPPTTRSQPLRLSPAGRV